MPLQCPRSREGQPWGWPQQDACFCLGAVSPGAMKKMPMELPIGVRGTVRGKGVRGSRAQEESSRAAPCEPGGRDPPPPLCHSSYQGKIYILKCTHSGAATMESSGEFLQQFRAESGHKLKLHPGTPSDTCVPALKAVRLTKAKPCSQPEGPVTDEGYTGHHRTLSLREERNSDPCSNVDEPWIFTLQKPSSA